MPKILEPTIELHQATLPCSPKQKSISKHSPHKNPDPPNLKTPNEKESIPKQLSKSYMNLSVSKWEGWIIRPIMLQNPSFMDRAKNSPMKRILSRSVDGHISLIGNNPKKNLKRRRKTQFILEKQDQTS